MICPKCKSQNVNIQIVNEVKLKRKHHGILWWIYFLFIGWLISIMMWIFLFWIKLIITIFRIFRPRKKIINTEKKMCVCQNCGHQWDFLNSYLNQPKQTKYIQDTNIQNKECVDIVEYQEFENQSNQQNHAKKFIIKHKKSIAVTLITLFCLVFYQYVIIFGWFACLIYLFASIKSYKGNKKDIIKYTLISIFMTISIVFFVISLSMSKGAKV